MLSPSMAKPVYSLETIRASIGSRIRSQRLARGWTQAELARRSNIRIETLNKIERGHRVPHAKTLAGIEAAFKGEA